MLIGELCCKCSTMAVRTLGAYAYCHEHAEAILEPCRQGVGARYGLARRIKPSEDGGWWLICQMCEASWVGAQGDDCPWCMKRYEMLQEETRNHLLEPSWLNTENAGSVRMWKHRLGRAVKSGLITDADARKAIQKAHDGRWNL